MHPFVVYNQNIISFEEARLSAISNAALYGKGVFTTVAIYNQKPFLWEKHWRRLFANAKKISIKFSESNEKTIQHALSEIIKANNVKSGRARITIFDSTTSSIWHSNSNADPNCLIQTADFRLVKKNFRLIVSPFRLNSTSPLANVKSCNYLENTLALEKALAENFDEAIRLNERGEIVSACLANVFWKKGKMIFTPRIETGCLEGTTREFILENFAVEEVVAELNNLKNADAIFLTSAGIGIVKVKIFDY